MARLIWICILKGTRKNCGSCLVIILCTVWNNEVVKLKYGLTGRSGIQDSFLFYQWAKVVHMKYSFQWWIPIKMTKPFWYVRIVFCPSKLVLFDFYVLNHKQHCCLICGVTFHKRNEMQAQTFQNFKVFRGESPRYSRLRRREYSHPCSQMQLPNENLGLGLYHCWKVVLFIIKLTADYLPTSGQFSICIGTPWTRHNTTDPFLLIEQAKM